jgi:hypothetical protein
MPKESELHSTQMDRLNHGLDRLLYACSTYALPILIGLVSLLALFAWKTQYPVVEPQQLQIRVIQGSASVLDPAQALAQLRGSSISQFHDTQLSEAPIWFSFVLPKEVEATTMMVEFPSRHAMDIACWDARTLKALGNGNHQGTTGGISAIKAGFALELSPALKDEQVLCRTSAIGPARLSALIWRAGDLQTSAQQFHRKSGLLDGGIIVLAIFVPPVCPVRSLARDQSENGGSFCRMGYAVAWLHSALRLVVTRQDDHYYPVLRADPDTVHVTFQR